MRYILFPDTLTVKSETAIGKQHRQKRNEPKETAPANAKRIERNIINKSGTNRKKHKRGLLLFQYSIKEKENEEREKSEFLIARKTRTPDAEGNESALRQKETEDAKSPDEEEVNPMGRKDKR